MRTPVSLILLTLQGGDAGIDPVQSEDLRTGVQSTFEREAQWAGRKPGDPHPFVAPDDFRLCLNELLVNGRKKLDKEREKAGTNWRRSGVS